MNRSKLGVIMLLGLAALTLSAVTADSASAAICHEFTVFSGEFKNISLSEAECKKLPQEMSSNAKGKEVFWVLVDQWEDNGTALTSTVKVTTSSEFLLEDMTAKTNLLCSATLVGTVGPQGAGEVELVENLSGKNNELECEVMEHGVCEVGNGQSLVVKPISLPWKTQMEESAYENSKKEEALVEEANAFPSTAGWEVKCKVLGVTVTDQCVGADFAVETNVTGGVEGKFEEELGKATQCSGDSGEGLIVGSGITKLVEGGTLSIE